MASSQANCFSTIDIQSLSTHETDASVPLFSVPNKCWPGSTPPAIDQSAPWYVLSLRALRPNTELIEYYDVMNGDAESKNFSSIRGIRQE